MYSTSSNLFFEVTLCRSFLIIYSSTDSLNILFEFLFSVCFILPSIAPRSNFDKKIAASCVERYPIKKDTSNISLKVPYLLGLRLVWCNYPTICYQVAPKGNKPHSQNGNEAKHPTLVVVVNQVVLPSEERWFTKPIGVTVVALKQSLETLRSSVEWSRKYVRTSGRWTPVWDVRN